MSRTINTDPYDVQMRNAWGDTEPVEYVNPVTGEAWSTLFRKGSRPHRLAAGVGTVEYLPGAHVGGTNDARFRAYRRPRIAPAVSEWDDDGALAAYESEQAWLDQESEDLYSGALDEDEDYEYVCPDPSCCFCGTCDCDLDEVG